MKTISIVVPCFNEEGNVIPLSEALVNEMNTSLPSYDYEIIFIDNDSKDSTREKIEQVCKSNKKIKAIYNVRNFGPWRSPYYGLLQATGDCAIMISADFQDPVEMIPMMVEEWEKGYKIVSTIKTASIENPIMRFLRHCYYKIIQKMSDVEQIEQFTGFGLYDREFLEIMRNLKEPTPFLRGIVAELGYKRKDLQYVHQKRATGKSHFNLYSLYDGAMLSFTSYTKIGLRLCTILGFIIATISIVIGLMYLVLKLANWDSFDTGSAPMLIGIFILGGLQMFFTGFMGEYILSINTRIMNRPLVIEEKRINFVESESNYEPTIKKSIGNL